MKLSRNPPVKLGAREKVVNSSPAGLVDAEISQKTGSRQ